MSAHTPGPWEWNEDNQLVSATESYPLQSYEDESDKKPVLIVETDSGFYPPRGPDRLLLAAAPDLKEALRDMLSGWRYIRETHGDLYGVGWDRAQEKAERALEAATGEPA